MGLGQQKNGERRGEREAGKRKWEEEVPGCVWVGSRERNWVSILGKKKERRERDGARIWKWAMTWYTSWD